jgi:hypothetical protein
VPANLPCNPSIVLESQTELDRFSSYYAEFLDGTYDCADRIVLNAYFQLGQAPGGFRYWWRQLKGSDDGLDNAHLMRFAGRFSRRVRAYAEKHSIPLIYCQRGERKHLIAAEYVPDDPDFVGVFAILVGRAPAPVWDVRCSKSGKILDIRRKEPYPYVNQYSFHIMDSDWGHFVIKLCPHPPFGAQIILNGHEYVACQARKTGISFEKEGNCFTATSDTAALAKIAETLCSPDAIGLLEQVCERWIYSSCLCFALTLEEQERTGFHYSYSDYQLEYSRNLLFKRGHQMEDLFNGVIDRIRAALDVKTLKTIFGSKRRPFRHKAKGKKAPRLEVVVERPKYDLTVLKAHFGKLTVKLYTKGEHVLRIEVIVHNARTLPCGCSLPRFPRIVAHLRGILNRFLDVVHCVDQAFISDDTLDQLADPTQVGRTRVGGIDLNKPRLRAMVEAVISLASAPNGFKIAELTTRVREIMHVEPDEYTSRQAAYDLKKLRGKHLVHKIGRSRRYQTTPDGLRAMTALLVLREKVIKPLLAGTGKPKRGRKPKNRCPIDAHYETIRLQMCNLFELIGVAV